VDKDLLRKDLAVEPAEMPRKSEKRSRTPGQEQDAERGVCQDAQRILFSRDKALHKDFKNPALIANPRGSVYQKASHCKLLDEEACACSGT
jgi:hypothetical protein